MERSKNVPVDYYDELGRAWTKPKRLVEALAEVERLRAALKQIPSLECPCCGEEGAFASLFEDGQETICGCEGVVSVMDYEEPAYIRVDSYDDGRECPKCEESE